MVCFASVLASCASGPRPNALSPSTAETGAPLSPAKAAYDVLAYDLSISVDPRKKRIDGRVVVTALVLSNLDRIELDLDRRLQVGAAYADGQAARVRRDDGTLTVLLDEPAPQGEQITVTIDYGGEPHVAKRAPWDGGFTWSKTPGGEPWVATSVQGEGCDLWWPCKDHFLDKPDEMDIRVTVPEGLVAVSNGLLQSATTEKGRSTYHWRTEYPVTQYNVAIAVGPFVLVEDEFKSVSGATLPLRFWALPEHQDDARNLFPDILGQLEFYERRLGPYPWQQEKIGIVETPFLGMEHQTVNAYGAGYEVNDHGYDWLLHHELGHEWFGNAMTHARRADFWLHEGTEMYMQPVYAGEVIGDFSYDHYMYDNYLKIRNCEAVIPSQDDGSAFDNGDVYYKGAWFLHTLRGLIGEEAFWGSLRALIGDDPGRIYRTTNDYERIVKELSGRDLGWLFDGYLRHAEPPRLVLERDGDEARLFWETGARTPFPLPVEVEIDGRRRTIAMNGGEGRFSAPAGTTIRLDPDGKVYRYLPITEPCGA